MEVAIQASLTKEVLKKASKLYNTPFETIKTIGGFENFVFEYNKNDNDYILRFVHSSHRSTYQVHAELEFIDYLDKNNCPVSTVVHSEEDNLVEVIQIDDNNYFTICVFEKAPGTFCKKDDLTDIFYKKFGKEVGRLHKLTKLYKPTHKRIDWDEESIVEIAEKSLPEKDAKIIEIYKELVKKIKNLPKNIDNFGLIHTDLHFGNMFIQGGELMFFDWDDSSYKHFISDIAIVLFYHFSYGDISQEVIDKESQRILALFLIGYQEENSIEISFLKNLNDFLMLRTIILYIVIYAAGDKMLESDWGKNYIAKYRNRIIEKVPFLSLEIVLKDLK
jgi:Ser/Thr protein kinase RdoA (MazF antagonist)